MTTSASIPDFQNLSGETYRTADPTSLKKAHMIRAKILDKQTSLLFETDTILPAIPSAGSTLRMKDQVRYKIDILQSTETRAARMQSNQNSNWRFRKTAITILKCTLFS